MGSLITKLLSFVRAVRNGANVSLAVVDRGGVDIVSPLHFSPPGDDSYPIPGDYVQYILIRGTRRGMVAGYIDPQNGQKAGPGEKRIYARPGSQGASVVELWLKSDGTAVLSNAAGSVTLSPSGQIESKNGACTFTLSASGSIGGQNGGGSFLLAESGEFQCNGARITTSGEVVSSNNKHLGTHTHSQGADSDGDAQQETSQPS